MIKSFKDKEAEKIFGGIRSAKLPGNIQEAALRRLKYLDNAVELDDLRVPPSNRFESLNGRPGVYSIRINIHTNLRTVIDKSCSVDRRWIFVVNRRAIWSIARGFTAKIGFCKQADCL